MFVMGNVNLAKRHYIILTDYFTIWSNRSNFVIFTTALFQAQTNVSTLMAQVRWLLISVLYYIRYPYFFAAQSISTPYFDFENGLNTENWGRSRMRSGAAFRFYRYRRGRQCTLATTCFPFLYAKKTVCHN